MTELPDFNEGVSMPSPGEPAVIRILDGDLARSVLNEYRERVTHDYDGAPLLDVLSLRRGALIGSNAFAAVLMNRILSELGWRVAGPADLETAIGSRSIRLRRETKAAPLIYYDTALLLRHATGFNAIVARPLLREVRRRQVQPPIMIPMHSLDLVKSERSPYGLAFQLRQDATVLPVRIPNKDGCFTSSDVDDATGLPQRVRRRGPRHFYGSREGLARIYLGGNLIVDSASTNLAGSDAGGRIVMARI